MTCANLPPRKFRKFGSVIKGLLSFFLQKFLSRALQKAIQNKIKLKKTNSYSCTT